ncbi:transposase [Mesorhizobium australicum]|uniref:transposase n=1 Tax=Mesorhizobium australicum TaxID=536018 RepID=UPI003335118C
MVNLTTTDSSGARAVLDGIRKVGPGRSICSPTTPYDRLKLVDKVAHFDFVVAIIRRSDDQKGFQVLPRRWAVERTFGWMTRTRRLVRHCEQRIDVSHVIVLVPS